MRGYRRHYICKASVKLKRLRDTRSADNRLSALTRQIAAEHMAYAVCTSR